MEKTSKFKGKPKPRRERASRPPPPKPTFKIVVRKLPIRDYSLESFQTDVSRICSELGVEASNVAVDHFSQGKLRLRHVTNPIPLTFFFFFFNSNKISVASVAQYLESVISV